MTEFVEFGDTDGDADAREDADGEREARADNVAVDSAESEAETEGLDDVDIDNFGDEESDPVTELVEVLREVAVPTAETVVLVDLLAIIVFDPIADRDLAAVAVLEADRDSVTVDSAENVREVVIVGEIFAELENDASLDNEGDCEDDAVADGDNDIL